MPCSPYCNVQIDPAVIWILSRPYSSLFCLSKPMYFSTIVFFQFPLKVEGLWIDFSVSWLISYSLENILLWKNVFVSTWKREHWICDLLIIKLKRTTYVEGERSVKFLGIKAMYFSVSHGPCLEKCLPHICGMT